MKNLKITVVCFVLTMLLVSCGSSKPVLVQNNKSTSKTITETVHDTVFKTEKDSSYYQAYLDCVDGKVLVREVIKSEPGRNLKSPKVRIDGSTLKVDCLAEAEELFAQWKSKFITESMNNELVMPVVTNVLTFGQQLKIKLFWLFLIILLALAIWQFIKSKIK
jgi:hypothetical protein